MKNIRYYLFTLAAALGLAGCSEFDKMNQDINKPANVTAAMVATDLTYDIINKGGFGGDKNFIYDILLAKQLAWWEGAQDEQYNKIGTQAMYFQVITNGRRMLELCHEDDKEAYSGLALFAKVNNMFETSMKLGDIAYSEAGLAEEGLITPKYDPQKDVMIGLLNDIDQAYTHFSNAGKSFAGDLIYNGNVDKWKRAAAALELKILIHLSKKEADAGLNVKERFARVVSQKALFQSNSDNFQIEFENKQNMYYPFSSLNSAHQTYAMVSTVVIDPLKELGDYRLFYFAEPAAAKISEGLSESDMDAYIGTDPSAPMSDITKAQGLGMYCKLGQHFTSAEDPVGEPLLRFSYAEQCFTIAEAALRGWISGDANDYYKKGIEAAMKFTADNTLTKHTHGMPMTDEYIQEFINKPEVQLQGDFENKLNQIITQKYIASFMQFSYNPYFDYRRTGYPVFPINPATSRNDDGYKDQLPTRWRYRPAEYSSNRENLNEALIRQFGEERDTNNDLIWILK